MARVIGFHYTLTDQNGNIIDSSSGRGPLLYMEGTGQIIPGLEKELQSLNKGDKKKVSIPAKEAYGERQESMVLQVPLDKLPKQDIKVGNQFRGGADNHSPVFTVIEVTATEAKLDGNHPLAGQDLNFDVELVEIREATAEEMQHGHAHSPDGHHH